MIEYGLLILFPFLTIYAAFSDLFTMTISNKISVILIVGFMVFAVLLGMDWETIAWHWAMFGIVLAAGFALFALNVMGGGDVKLAASTALWLGWEHTLDYILLTSILGAFLSIAIVLFRANHLPMALERVGWISRMHDTKSDVPYGVALGVAAMAVYPLTPWFEYIGSSTSL